MTPDTPAASSRRDTPGDIPHSERDDLLLRELQALREQVTQLQEEVRELRRLPAPEQLQGAHKKASQDDSDSLHRPTGGAIKGFEDLLKRFEAKH